MIKDEKFIGILNFIIKFIIYNSLFDLNNQHFIDLIETKVRYHYDSYKSNKDNLFIQN